MKISIHKVHYPVTTLGYGRRVAIWMQGCSIRCPGCINKDTWRRNKQCDIELDDFLPPLRKWLKEADGVTISGGEPFDQPGALRLLMHRLRDLCSGDLLIFTGYKRCVIQDRFEDFGKLADVLVTGPYSSKAGCTLELRGSDNQEVILLSDLAHTRYPPDINCRQWPERRHLDVFADDTVVWMAGITRSSELSRLKSKLGHRGLKCTVSDEKGLVSSP